MFVYNGKGISTYYLKKSQTFPILYQPKHTCSQLSISDLCTLIANPISHCFGFLCLPNIDSGFSLPIQHELDGYLLTHRQAEPGFQLYGFLNYRTTISSANITEF